MFKSAFRSRLAGSVRAACAFVLASTLLGGCIDGGEYQFGINVTGITYVLFDETEGIHPSDVVLVNPNNPFRNYDLSQNQLFSILGNGGSAGAYYAWATQLARIPVGENQFYTAALLQSVAQSGELNEEDSCRVTLQAARAYQAVLDEFPDSVSFNEDGSSFFLAPLAYNGIRALGQPVRGDWVDAVDENGNRVVIRIAGLDTPRIVFPEEVVDIFIEDNFGANDDVVDPCNP